MKITPATTKDAAALSKLAKVMGYEATAQEIKDRVEKISRFDDHCLLVAKEGEQITGFCHGYVRTLVEVEPAVEIGGLSVTEDFQGKGVARALVEGIETWAKDRGIKLICIASSTYREQAHGFYEHLGYKKVRQQFVFMKQV